MSSGQTQQFCVRWNSHLGSIGAAFPQVRTNNCIHHYHHHSQKSTNKTIMEALCFSRGHSVLHPLISGISVVEKTSKQRTTMGTGAVVWVFWRRCVCVSRRRRPIRSYYTTQPRSYIEEGPKAVIHTILTAAAAVFKYPIPCARVLFLAVGRRAVLFRVLARSHVDSRLLSRHKAPPGGRRRERERRVLTGFSANRFVEVGLAINNLFKWVYLFIYVKFVI